MDVAWMPSGEAVVFVHPESALLYEVDLTFTPELSAGPQRQRLSSTIVNDTVGREFHPHPDGKRFVLGGRSAALTNKMVVVVNWLEELKRLALLTTELMAISRGDELSHYEVLDELGRGGCRSR